MRQLTKVSRTLAILVSAATLSLGAETVYYAKPDAVGAKTDGASWDTATSLTNALALAGANVPASVYVAKGAYRFKDFVLTLTPGVSVYGGFSGTDANETIATRDFKTNVSVVFGWCGNWGCNARWRVGSTGALVQRNGKNLMVLEDDGTLNVPDPTEEEAFWYPERGETVFQSVVDKDTEESEFGVVLDGLTVSGRLDFKKVSATIRNCRIFGAHGNSIYSSGRYLLVEDSDIEYGLGTSIDALNWNSTDKNYTPTFVIRRVNLRHMAPNNWHGCGIFAQSIGTNIIENCVFEENYSHVRYANHQHCASFISCGDSTIQRITNSSFIRNYFSTNTLSLVWMPSYESSVVSNCLFLGNQVVGDRQGSGESSQKNATASLVYARRNDSFVIDCSFVSNVVDRWESEAKDGVTTLPCAIVDCPGARAIRRCTFEGNRVSATTSVEGLEPIAATVTCLGERTDPGILFGCTFNNNVATSGDVAFAFKSAVRFYNTIFWSASDAYVPATNVGTNENSKLTFRNCVVKNYPADATWLTDCEDNQTGDPCLGELKKVGSILVRYPSTGGSARRKGRQLYYDAYSNVDYRNAAGTYLRCDLLSTWAVKEPLVAISDALGVFAATGKNPDIGAVNALPAGLMLIVR